MPEDIAKPTIIDGRTFVESGVGLITISNEGKFLEKIPAKPFEKYLTFSSKEIEKRFLMLERRVSELATRLEELSTKYEDLLSTVHSMESRFSSIEQEIVSLREEIKSGLVQRAISTKRVEVPTATPTVSLKDAEELPSFVRDNPWLEVLAKRGKEREGR